MNDYCGGCYYERYNAHIHYVFGNGACGDLNSNYFFYYARNICCVDNGFDCDDYQNQYEGYCYVVAQQL